MICKQLLTQNCVSRQVSSRSVEVHANCLYCGGNAMGHKRHWLGKTRVKLIVCCLFSGIINIFDTSSRDQNIYMPPLQIFVRGNNNYTSCGRFLIIECFRLLLFLASVYFFIFVLKLAFCCKGLTSIQLFTCKVFEGQQHGVFSFLFCVFQLEMHTMFTAQDTVRASHTRDPTQTGLTGPVNCLSACLITVKF
jgi:hypothetical protein